MQIAGNPEFPPSITDITFKRWARRDLQPSSYFQDKFLLAQTDMFRYFQIRHYIMNHKGWNIIKNAPTNMEKHFINIIKHKSPTKTHVPHIYRNLMLDIPGNTFYIKNKWELEFNIVIEDDAWGKNMYGMSQGH